MKSLNNSEHHHETIHSVRKEEDKTANISYSMTSGQIRKQKVLQFLGYQFIARTANLTIFVVAAIFIFIFYKSMAFFHYMWQEGKLWEIFISPEWHPTAEHPEFGMLSMVYGTFQVTLGALLIAVPVGLTAAVVLSDMVPFRVRQWIKPMIELLAAVPSVAFGFFAITVVAPWLQNTFGFTTGTNSLNASLILAVMAIPLIVSVAEDALTGLGRELREASYGCGATRFETIFKVIIPAAHNGIIAAVVLGMMRAVGETMVVLMAAGNASNVPVPWYDLTQIAASFTEAVQTMTATIARDMGETPANSIHRSALFAVGFILLVITFCMNLLTERLSKKFRETMGRSVENKKNSLGKYISVWKILFFLPKYFITTGHYFFSSIQTTVIHHLGAKKYLSLRMGMNHAFNGFAVISILILVLALGMVMGPIFVGGVEAVVFRGTVEHRLFIHQQFGRGNLTAVKEEWRRCSEARAPIYRELEYYAWLSPDLLEEEARKMDRATRDFIERNYTKPEDQETVREMTSACKRIRRAFTRMCGSTDPTEIEERYADIQKYAQKNDFRKTPLMELLNMAEKYQKNVAAFIAETGAQDLSIRDMPTKIDENVTYAEIYRQMRNIITGQDGNGCILGPEIRGEKINHLPPEVRYGATHWSQAKKYLDDLLTVEVYKKRFSEAGIPLENEKIKVARKDFFDETPLTGLTRMMKMTKENLSEMMNPRWTFYGYYFLDPSTAGHFLGGVGPELLGTLLITILSVVLAMPVGVITAAYLVEVAKDNFLTRLTRLCINTLAGVPSIVFGLFGLAVIVEMMTGKPSVLAGGMTLALLILPIIIRSSEEAIRSVPVSFREAALGLGAGRAKCFFSVVLPASLPGILTGTILAMSRAAGETAPLLFTCAVAYGAAAQLGPDLLMQATPVLSYSALDIATGDRLAKLVPYNQYGLVLTLILVVLALNALAIWLRGRISSKLRG
ncbi:MAG: phosphate ABC transporter permease subunit PstC [Planctomycetia bacterium]|nr:phosphate ABC transporter permease subunit PstC [Planctomycetia bacterium]